MKTTTCIRDCSWVVAWSQSSGKHEYLRAVDIAFTGDTIKFIGKRYTGAVDEEIDGSRLFVQPGLIDIHSHPSLEPSYKGIREEHGVPEMYMSGLYERCVSMFPDEGGQELKSLILNF